MSRCNCYSAIDGKGQESMMVKPPKWSSKEWISVDPCVWPFVKALWDAGVETQGSCCGHGDDKPSVVVVFEDINKAITVAFETFPDVKIFAWFNDQIDVFYGANEHQEEIIQQAISEVL